MGTLDYKTENSRRISLNGSIFFNGGIKNSMYHKLFLVPFADTETFAEKITLFAHDENLRKEMGAAGLNRVHKHFVIEDRIIELDNCIFNL